MIERIVRKESVDEQEDIEEYMQANGEIMDKIHSAFFLRLKGNTQLKYQI